MQILKLFCCAIAAMALTALCACTSLPPIETTQTTAPMETTTAPAETTTVPVETTAEPVETTAEPAETTTVPVETTSVPVVTTTAPVETTTAPAETTTVPVETTTVPVVTTTAPAETTIAPVETATLPAETTAQTPEPTLPNSGNLLFNATQKGIYNYCPAVIEQEDGTRYIYYCTNQKSYDVTDYIGCRKGTPNADGTYTYGEETIALAPSEDLWDAHHTCDPSVICGDFTYQGTSYRYLMAYLGCTSYDSQDNKIGLAVANSPEGPFVKVGNVPIVDFTMDPTVTVFQWGVGQPSLVSMDKVGKVWLFYTRGDKNGTRTVVRICDFSSLDAPVIGAETKLSTMGLKDLSGNADILNNADFMYDPATERFYAASDCHPNPSDTPNYIASHFRLTYFAKPAFTSAKWQEVATIGESETGFARNHNVGLVRDIYGHLIHDGFITIYYTVSVTGDQSLWSYRIYDYYIPLGE